MKFTKMNITGQLNDADSARVARNISTSYVIAAVGIAVAAVIYAIRWW